MILYPWLKKKYKKILSQYLKKKLHHSIIIRTQTNLGSNVLIFLLCQRILCINPQNYFSCNICHNCQLVKSNNYPDLHIIYIKKNKTIGIDYFLKFIKKSYQTSKLGKKTIIWIPKIHLLTESSMNAFLKILEEPPLNILFFLEYNSFFKLKKTIRSRCIIYNIYPPTEKKGILWLKKKTNKFKTKDLLTALKLSENSPIIANRILQSTLWNERKFFLSKLKKSIKNKNLFYLLKFFKKKIKKKIFWIYLIILDAIKIYYNKKITLINHDQKKLISVIYKKHKIKDLYTIINLWKKSFFYINNISKINKKFILLEPIIIWENIINIK
ncbi:DNA polymerase III subunit delta' C-terminal domain-containing protein [Buchnera aphidicola]|uniref:DNA polymerase III subunit delta' C-terminal domain-containing protein n=1 Tax=Buchnera aphidicola TaxID=9 RepID=UPI003464086A